MTPAQCRAARAMLGLEREELAAQAAVAPATLAAFEDGEDMPAEIVATLRAALENAGVIFIAEAETSPAGTPKGTLKDYVQYPEFLSPEASTGSGG